MKPIRDISDLYLSSVLYHSAFGFARVIAVERTGVALEWEQEAENLPSSVSHETIVRIYAICEQDGFFDRSMKDPDALCELLIFQPLDALNLLLNDLTGPQTKSSLSEWLVGRKLMTKESATHWWGAVEHVVVEDDRFVVEGRVVRLASQSDDTGPVARLRNPTLSPTRRLELALAHRQELEVDFFLENVMLAWRLGGIQVRDLALQAAKADYSPSQILTQLLSPGPDAIEAVVHAVRHGGWEIADLDESVHSLLLNRVVSGCDAGGPLDNEGRLVATLTRWSLPGLIETLCDLGCAPNGKRLLRAVFKVLPSTRAESLALDLIECSLESDALDTANWLGGEALSLALIDKATMSEKLAEDRPDLAEWFRTTYQGVDVKGLDYDELTDDATAYTAEVDFSEIVSGPIPLSRLPPRSGASLLGLGLSISRALAVHHKDGTICNPTADRVFVLPTEAMEITPGGPEGAHIPHGEALSLTSDVYASAVLLVQCLMGRPWPEHIPAQRAIPYLRYVISALPPAAVAPLDLALHPDPALRPKDGLAWQALWQVAAVAEEKRSYARREPSARLNYGYDSHIGRAKMLRSQTNQDSVFVSTKGPLTLLVVCDGISTANAGSGDVASSIATHVIANLWEQALPRLVEAGPAETREFLDRALRMANQAVCEAALRFGGGNLEGRVPMGTTAVVALVYGNHIWFAWLGDSRAYLVGNYGTSLLTFDENQASERLRAWHLRFIDEWDPAGFALVGYLGHFDEMWRPEALPAHHANFTLVPGERFVLCSDGVTDYLGDSHPEAALHLAEAVHGNDPYHAAQQLIVQANRGGGGDNITTIVAGLFEH